MKLHRSVLEWEWFDDKNTSRLFIILLLMANHEDKKWKGRTIERGSFFTSLDNLAKQSGLTNMAIRTILKKLIITGEITDESCSTGRMITILNYEKYQCDNRQSNRQVTDKVTDEQQTSNRRVTATKEVKNYKKEKKKEIYTSPAAPNCVDYSVFGMTDYQISEVKRIRKKNKGGAITQRVANGLAKEFHNAAHIGVSFDESLTEWETRGWKSFKADWLKPKTSREKGVVQRTIENFMDVELPDLPARGEHE